MRKWMICLVTVAMLNAVVPVHSETVETRIGTLEFNGGFPTQATIHKAYDQLDGQRATQAYLEFMPMMSVNSIFEAHIRDYGWKTSSDIQIYVEQGKGKAGAIGLTYNTESIYASAHTDLKKDGPTVMELPPDVLGQGCECQAQGIIYQLCVGSGRRFPAALAHVLPP